MGKSSRGCPRRRSRPQPGTCCRRPPRKFGEHLPNVVGHAIRGSFEQTAKNEIRGDRRYRKHEQRNSSQKQQVGPIHR